MFPALISVWCARKPQLRHLTGWLHAPHEDCELQLDYSRKCFSIFSISTESSSLAFLWPLVSRDKLLTVQGWTDVNIETVLTSGNLMMEQAWRDGILTGRLPFLFFPNRSFFTQFEALLPVIQHDICTERNMELCTCPGVLFDRETITLLISNCSPCALI